MEEFLNCCGQASRDTRTTELCKREREVIEVMQLVEKGGDYLVMAFREQIWVSLRDE